MNRSPERSSIPKNCLYRQFRSCSRILPIIAVRRRLRMTPLTPSLSNADRPVNGLSADAAKAQRLGTLHSPRWRTRRLLPRMRWPVQAGFPSPAEDDQDAAIDLNELLAPTRRPAFCCASAVTP